MNEPMPRYDISPGIGEQCHTEPRRIVHQAQNNAIDNMMDWDAVQTYNG